MVEIFTRTFNINRYYGEEIQIISLLGGKHSYVFYTIRSADTNIIGLFEVFINQSKGQHLVYDSGELTIISKLIDKDNNGAVHLGGGENTLLIFFDNFQDIFGFTMCDYKSVVSDIGATTCKPLEPLQYKVEPFSTDFTQCNKVDKTDSKKSKIDFICLMEKKTVNYTRYILFVLVAAGAFFCLGSTVVFCKFRQKYNI